MGSSNNCYLWSPNVINVVYNISKQNELGLWHKRLDHVSFISIRKALTKNVIIGLPSPPDVYEVICGNCHA